MASTELRAIYGELRRVARRMLDLEPYPHTLESMELVNLAFARLLIGDLRDVTLDDPRRVVAAAVLHMRRELVDHARRRKANKRPDPRRRVQLDDALGMCESDPDTLLAVDALLDELGNADSVRNAARKAEVARYALYGGLTEAEISAALEIPKSTVGADLRFSRAWIGSRLGDDS